MSDPTCIVKQLVSATVNGSGAPVLSDIGEDQWKLVLGVCAAQNVHTLVFDFLPDNVPEELMTVWRGQAEAVAGYNRLSSKLREAQEKAWQSAGLNYALLKGESIAVLYPHPERRGGGDIDWYFTDAASWNRALALARKNAGSGLKRDSDGDVHFTCKGVVIEYHRDWTHLSSRKLRKIAGVPTIINGRLSPEDTILMLICHILHHLAFAGMGLKQYADLAVVLREYDGKYDRKALAERLRRLGLEKWSALLFGTLATLFDMRESVFPVPPSADRKDADRLTRIIFEDGCVPSGRKITAGKLLGKMSLMAKYCPREMSARYFHLAVGRLSRKKFVK